MTILRACSLVLAVLSLASTACSGKTDSAPDGPPDYTDPNAGFGPAATQELRDKGFGKYLGAFQPTKVTPTDTITYYQFGPDTKGPICMQGAPFKMSIRDGSSDDLLIYLMGGGACWTGKCAASTVTGGAPVTVGWTDGDVDRNPVGAYNLAFVGYCDGSVFAGDGEVNDPGNGAPDGIRYHHGLANLSAALDVARQHYPSPRRIVLAGSSAGGYGTIISTLVVRLVWPKTDLYVVNDAGLGLTNPNDPQMYQQILKDWNLANRIPDTCTECKDGQFSHLIAWALGNDPTLRVGGFSSYEDEVIGQYFLDMTGPDFKAWLLKQTGIVHDAYPSRFQRYFIEGSAHTAMLAGFYDVKVNGVGLPEWTRRMIDGDATWTDELENAGN